MSRPLCSALLLLSLLAGGTVQGLQAQEISTVSPFIPQGGATGPATENSPLELRGMLSDKDGRLFGLFDPVKRHGSWVKLNEAGRDFLVRSFDESSETAVVEYQGRVLTLVLKSAKIESMPAGRMQIAGAPAMPNQPPPAAASAVSQAEEAKRLEIVTAEVRRRRAARQAATQQGTAANQPAPAPQGAQPVPPPRR